jgi:tRNA A37 methylthiotransferase MiaB
MFRTDLMVGFPTESETELDNSINFVSDYFDEVAIYGFELKKNTPIARSCVNFFDDDEVKRRMEYARDKMHAAGLMVHSGGQLISTLIENDIKKEEIRTRMMK